MTPQDPDFRYASKSERPQHVSVFAKSKPGDPDPDSDLLQEARENFRHVNDYESEERRRWEEELRFVDELKHWTDDQKKERKGLPSMTFDRIGPSIDQVVNDMRQNPPEPRVSPIGNGADKWTAQVYQGLLRNIDNDSGADIAWMTAYEHAVKVGRGWVRVMYDYEYHGGQAADIQDPARLFDVKLLIRRIPNPFSVYADPAAEEYDYSDMRFCLVTEKMDKKLFEASYPNARSTPWATFEGAAGDRIKEDWWPQGLVRVAEYWWTTTEQAEIYLLQDGSVVTLDQMPPGAVIQRQRKQQLKRVHMAKITGSEVLETLDWPGRWIPIVPVLGREYIADGKRFLRGMIRAAMDANLSYDYMRSRQAQAIGLAPIAPFMVAEGQIENHKAQWDLANRVPWPYLTYRQTDSEGRPAPAPIRTHAEVEIQGITMAVQAAENDIKAMLSTYDASLGNQGPESSGRAILARQREGDNAHFHYADNLARSMRHMARINIDLIPYVYSEARAISIFDPDGSVRQVEINQPTMHEGVQRIFDLANPAARYDVTIGTGPSYASKRAQGAAALMQIIPQMPVLGARAPDLLIKALDIPDAEAIGDRIRPPDVKQQQGETPSVPALQAQLGQMSQMIQMLSQKLDESTKQIEQKNIEWGARKEIAALEGQVTILRAEISAKSAEMQTLAKLDHAGVKHRLDLEQMEGHQQEQPSQSQPPQPGPLPAPGGPPAGAPPSQPAPPETGQSAS